MQNISFYYLIKMCLKQQYANMKQTIDTCTMVVYYILVDESQKQILLPTIGHFNETGGFPYNVGFVVGVAVGLTGLTISRIMALIFTTKLR